MPRTTARYSRAISRARPDTVDGSATGSASTHRPGWSLGDGAADDGPGQPAEHQRPLAAGQLALVLDPRDGADAGVPGADAGHEQDPAVAGDGAVGGVTRLVGLERQRHDHLREDHPGRQGQQRQGQGFHRSRSSGLSNG